MATQVLPSPPLQYQPNHMGYGHDPLNQFSHFEHVASRDAHYNPNPASQTHLLISPRSLNSEMPYRRRSSNSPQAPLNVPAVRERTPIRHNRPSISRDRSHSRGDMLLAYANEHNQLHQTQSLPSIAAMPSHTTSNTPQMFGLPSYNLSPSMSAFSQPSAYFSPPLPPRSNQQDTAGEFSLHQNEIEGQSFFPVGRTISHGSAMSLPQPDSSDSLYMHGQSQQSQQPLPSIGMTMQPFPPVPLTLESSPAEIEVMPARPKPQCWDHGCNGRQFSTFSNLLRHQREKSGSAIKATCPHCGTEFTRTTARNGHMSGGKCKGKPEDDVPEE